MEPETSPMPRQPSRASGRGTSRVNRYSALELFTTQLLHVTSVPQTALPCRRSNSSPDPQDFASGGELIGPAPRSITTGSKLPPSLQPLHRARVVDFTPRQSVVPHTPQLLRLIHHAGQNPGELFERRLLTPAWAPTVVTGQSKEDCPAWRWRTCCRTSRNWFRNQHFPD